MKHIRRIFVRNLNSGISIPWHDDVPCKNIYSQAHSRKVNVLILIRITTSVYVESPCGISLPEYSSCFQGKHCWFDLLFHSSAISTSNICAKGFIFDPLADLIIRSQISTSLGNIRLCWYYYAKPRIYL